MKKVSTTGPKLEETCGRIERALPLSDRDIFREFNLLEGHPWAEIAQSPDTNYYSCLYGVVQPERPKKILEIGAAFGMSASTLLKSCEEVELFVSLDLGIFGDQLGGGGSNIDFARSRVHNWCGRGGIPIERVRFYQANTQPSGKGDNDNIGADIPKWHRIAEVARLLEWTEFDVVFVDGKHTEDGLLNDFNSFWPFLKPGGLMVCDDLHDPAIYGGTHAWVGDTWRSFEAFVKSKSDEIADWHIWDFPRVPPQGPMGARPFGLIRKAETPVPNGSKGFEMFDSADALEINHARQDHLLSLGLDLAHKRVLEVGSGIGRHTGLFEKLGCTVLSTEARPENVVEHILRYPHRKGKVEVVDLEVPGSHDRFGTFDIIYCYGALYHLNNPAQCIEDLSSVCGETFLLETCVNGVDNGDVNPIREDQSSYNQSYTGLGCRPGRDWIMAELQKHFPYVYITATQPYYPDFELEWPVPDGAGRNARAVFVASRRQLDLPALTATCPAHQSKISPALSGKEITSQAVCHAELVSASHRTPSQTLNQVQGDSGCRAELDSASHRTPSQTLNQVQGDTNQVQGDTNQVQGDMPQPTQEDPAQMLGEWIKTVAKSENRLYYRDQTVESLGALVDMVRTRKPTRIVELGTLSGLSLRAWLAADNTTPVTAVDLSFKSLDQSKEILPIDLSRVTLVEKNILELDFASLWKPDDKVILYVDAHDDNGVPIMRRVIENALPSLPEGGYVVVDDLWYSPETLDETNAARFLEEHIVDQIDSLQSFEGRYASYWKGGSFFGFLEVVPLMEWVNRNHIELDLRPDVKTIAFAWPAVEVGDHVTISGKAEYNPAPNGGYYGQAVNFARFGRYEEAVRLLAMELAEPSPHPRASRLLSDIEVHTGKRSAPDIRTSGHSDSRTSGLTIFAMPKRFRDHAGIIQRNAIKSWTLMNPRPEIILFGDEEGTAEIAREMGLRHEPDTERSEFGTPLVNHLFRRAEELAANRIIAYVNSDIILPSDFVTAALEAGARFPEFLMVGQRWDVKIDTELDFNGPGQDQLRAALQSGRLHEACGIDYFVHTKGLYLDMPPFAIGRFTWDNWLVCDPLSRNIPVIDATQVITAIHQDHDYSHVKGGTDEAVKGVEAQRNASYGGRMADFGYVTHATWALTPSGLINKQENSSPGEATPEWLQAMAARINQANGDPKQLVQIGSELAERGHDDTAEELAHHVLGEDSRYPDAHNLLGCIYFKRGESADALRYFETAHRLEPENIDVGKNLAATYAQMGLFEEACGLCQEMLRLAPEDPELRSIIGDLLETISNTAFGDGTTAADAPAACNLNNTTDASAACNQNDTKDASAACNRSNNQRIMRLYSHTDYLPPGQKHDILLAPFWGETGGDGVESGRFDAFLATARERFTMTSIEDADVVILPGSWVSGGNEAAYRLSEEARKYGKPLVIFFNSDSDEEINIDNAVIFRTSFNRSTRKPNEFALPAFNVDFAERYLGGELILHRKRGKPIVGFCGCADTDPTHARRRAIDALQKSDMVQANFIIRPAFWAGASNDAERESARDEFVRNMVDSDYILCARGAGNFSYRLYETLSSGRIPVFVDTDCVLPFDDVINWKDYCVWIEASEIDSISEKVAAFHNSLTEQQFVELQYACRKLWEEWLCPVGFYSNFHRCIGDREQKGRASAPTEPKQQTAEPGCFGCMQPKQTRAGAHSCVFVNTYYGGFLDQHYGRHPELAEKSYEEQMTSLQGQFFGDCDFYSEGLRNAGWNATDLVVNCLPLQNAWARENGFQGDALNIAIEQIRRLGPDVVYIQDLVSLPVRDFVAAIRPYAKLIVGQIATPMTPQTDVTPLDVVFSSFPHYVERFRQQGVTAYYQPLAFDPRVLDNASNGGKVYPVSFVGGISHLHAQGNQFLETLARNVPMECWGYGAEALPADSEIRRHHHGSAWGLDMFSLLRKSRITINRHGEIAENFANNMRLFEATGCGALLVTDYKDNLNELFEVGRECVAYRTPEECVTLVKYYVDHPDEAERIAKAGQARTLRDHTYGKRMEQTAEILQRHLRYKTEAGRFSGIDTSNISSGHTLIAKSDVSDDMTSAWKSESIPEVQRALVQNELEQMYNGQHIQPYDVLADCLRPYVFPGCSALEIGCASGYYYEILEYLLNIRLDYTGVDYSEHLIAMAKDYYPNVDFRVADGADLPFEDRRFHTAISSSMLLHVPNYKEHIKETVRVADQFVVAHRTPICRARPTQYLKKMAYGVETVEILFNESEFISEFRSRGLKLIHQVDYHIERQNDYYGVSYVFKKI